MALEPIRLFQSEQSPLVQLLSGGNNTLTGILDKAVQIGRDISNKQTQQEQDMLGQRQQETALQQRRGENLQQNWQNLFSMEQKQNQFAAELGQKQNQFDASMALSRDQQDWSRQHAEQQDKRQQEQWQQTFGLQKTEAEQRQKMIDQKQAELDRQKALDRSVLSGGVSQVRGGGGVGDLLTVTTDPITGDSRTTVNADTLFSTPAKETPLESVSDALGRAEAAKATASRTKDSAALARYTAEVERLRTQKRQLEDQETEDMRLKRKATLDEQKRTSDAEVEKRTKAAAEGLYHAHIKDHVPNEFLGELEEVKVPNRNAKPGEPAAKIDYRPTEKFPANYNFNSRYMAAKQSSLQEFLASVGATKPEAVANLTKFWETVNGKAGESAVSDPVGEAISAYSR